MRTATIWVMLGLAAGACSKSPPETAGPTTPGARSDDMTTSKPGTGPGSAPPVVKTRAPGPPQPGPPRSTRTVAETVTGMESLPRVTTAAELAARDGDEVLLVGTYVERDVRMKAAPPPVHHGHAAIQLGDGKLVALLPSWDEDAVRPADEAARFAGKQVEVVGTISKRGIADPEGGASLMGPTIDEVRALRLAP
jgi:hypothetical protein